MAVRYVTAGLTNNCSVRDRRLGAPGARVPSLGRRGLIADGGNGRAGSRERYSA
jgi:hypothetical protein